MPRTRTQNQNAPKFGLGREFLKNKGVELALIPIVLTASGYLALKINGLNREVGELAARDDHMADHIHRLMDLPTSVAQLDQKVNTIQHDIDTVQNWQQGRIASIYQRATFRVVDSAATPRSYAWKLKQPIEPQTISGMTIQPIGLPQGVNVTSIVADDGSGCIMTVDGPTDVLQQLPAEISADVTFITRS